MSASPRATSGWGRWKEGKVDKQDTLSPAPLRCAFCGEAFDPAEMVEVEDGLWVCETCAVEEYGVEVFNEVNEWSNEA